MTHAIDRYGSAVLPVQVRDLAARTEATQATEKEPHLLTGKNNFWGEDGFTFSDLIDAVNPLNHIPGAAGLFASEDAPVSRVSVASRLIGGALLGGPVGFFASLVNAVFEQETGKGAAETMVAALLGDSPAPTQMALAAPDMPVEMAALTPLGDKVSDYRLPATVEQIVASSEKRAFDTDRAVLDLYGASPASAHKSYQNAQLRPYLRDVNHSQVL